MSNALRFLAVIAMSLLSGEISAWAAKPARVDVENLQVREGPNETSSVLGILTLGTGVAASNYPLEGYYKIRMPDGQVGWVPADALIVIEPDPEKNAFLPNEIKKRDKPLKPWEKRKRFTLDLLGGFHLFNPYDVNNLVGATVISSGWSGGIELGVPVHRKWSVLARGEYLIARANAQAADDESYAWAFQTLPVSLGVEFRPWRNKLWVTHVKAMGTIGLLTSFSSTASDQAEPNVTSYSGTAFGVLLSGGLSINPIEWFLVRLDAGYRFQTTAPLSMGLEGAGGSFLKDADGNYPSIRLKISGFSLHMGVGFHF